MNSSRVTFESLLSLKSKNNTFEWKFSKLYFLPQLVFILLIPKFLCKYSLTNFGFIYMNLHQATPQYLSLIAQLVEGRSLNPMIVGSSRASGINSL